MLVQPGLCYCLQGSVRSARQVVDNITALSSWQTCLLTKHNITNTTASAQQAASAVNVKSVVQEVAIGSNESGADDGILQPKIQIVHDAAMKAPVYNSASTSVDGDDVSAPPRPLAAVAPVSSSAPVAQTSTAAVAGHQQPKKLPMQAAELKAMLGIQEHEELIVGDLTDDQLLTVLRQVCFDSALIVLNPLRACIERLLCSLHAMLIVQQPAVLSGHTCLQHSAAKLHCILHTMCWREHQTYHPTPSPACRYHSFQLRAVPWVAWSAHCQSSTC